MCPITVDICLIDLDGTIVDTTDAVEVAWEKVATKHRADESQFWKDSHGRRASETFMQYMPKVDMDTAVKEFERALMAQSHYVALIPGANDLLLSLDRPSSGKPGEVFKESKWGIVTSATPSLAHSWFDTILKKIGKPQVFITSADVEKGKPDPEGFLKAKERLSALHGLDNDRTRVVVFEDSPLGIRAAKAMGAIAVGVTSSYNKDVLYRSGADYVVEDLAQICVMHNSKDGITLEITGSMERGGSSRDENALEEEDDEDYDGQDDDDDEDDDEDDDDDDDDEDKENGNGKGENEATENSRGT